MKTFLWKGDGKLPLVTREGKILALPRKGGGVCPDNAMIFFGFDKVFLHQPKVANPTPKKKKKKKSYNFPQKATIHPQFVNISTKYVNVRAMTWDGVTGRFGCYKSV